MIKIKRETLSVSRKISPAEVVFGLSPFLKKELTAFDQKGNVSQKRTRESTIKRYKVDLATSGNRVIGLNLST